MSDSINRNQLELIHTYEQTAQAPIEDAHSLPFGVYSDQKVHQLETEHVFGNEWIFIVSEQELYKAGDYFAFTLANEPLVIIRGKDEEMRALSNLCRHRGTPLLNEGYGNVTNSIICPYHAWAYSDDGTLKAAPLPGDVSINKEDHCLPRFHLESWHGLLFLHLGENPTPLMARLKGLDDYLGYFNLASFKYGYRSSGIERWHSNWKLALENAMESYHLFKVHQDTLETVTPTRQAFYIAGCSEWALTGGKMKDTSSKLMKWFSGSYPEVFENYVLISLPPSFVGILTHESLAWIQVLPVDADNCIVRSAGISHQKTRWEDKSEKSFVEAFFAEDKAICERVQMGMSSTLAQGGKLVTMERIIADFHQFLGSRLFNTPVSEFYEAPDAQIFLEGSGNET